MDQYICVDCDKTFLSPKALNYHIEHKVCYKYRCKLCNKNFVSQRFLDRHLKQKVCAKKDKTVVILTNTTVVSDTSVPMTTRERELYEENLQLKGQVEALKSHPQTQNIQNIQNIQNVLIVPPAFLKLDSVENLTKMLPELLHKAISKHADECVPFLIKETNCNPQLPLYNSVKITNRRDIYAQISDGDKYVYTTKKKAIADLIENKRHILQSYIDNNGEKYGDKILARYQVYVDALDENKEAQKELENDIACMLLDVSGVIGSDNWTRKLLEDLKMVIE